MGETNNQQVNVKLKLENGNVQGEGKEKDEYIYIYIYIYRFNSNVGGGETTINFARITKEKEEDICSQGIYPNSP
jgi:hypothetical protein